MKITQRIVTWPPIWNVIQRCLGFPEFKQKFYRSHLQPGGKLLDFGCATGHLAEIFKDYEYYGVDCDAPSIESAKQRFAEHQNMQFFAADICTNPFEENFFDQVVMGATAHHLSDEDFAAILKALAYCTKPEGIIHICDPVVQASDGWQQKLMRRMDQGKWPRTLAQFLAIIEPLGLFTVGEYAIEKPYGALIQDCDFLHLPLIVNA